MERIEAASLNQSEQSFAIRDAEVCLEATKKFREEIACGRRVSHHRSC